MKEARIKQDLEKTVENILLYQDSVQHLKPNKHALQRYDPKTFRRIDLYLSGDAFSEALYPGYFFFPTAECTPALVWPLDVTFLKTYTHDDESDIPGAELPKSLKRHKPIFQVSRVRSVPLADVRGRWKITSGKFVRTDVAYIHDDLTVWGLAEYYQWSSKGWMRQFPHNKRLGFDPMFETVAVLGAVANEYYVDIESDFLIRMAFSHAMRLEYDWQVRFVLDGNRFAFPVTPPAAKKLFSDRDKPAFKSRREALRNWVTSHWRDLPAITLCEQVQVVKHLRGATKFNWRGLDCEIVISPDSLREADRAKEEMPSPRPRRMIAGADSLPMM